MHYKNEAEIHTTTTDIAKSDSAKSPASCTSSTDSGIIMMDNCGIPGNDNNDNDYTKESQPNEQSTFAYNNNKTQTNNINIENIVNINKSHSPTPSAEKRPQNSRSSKPTNSPRHSPTANNSRHCSPTVSIRSTTISIVSIDENAIDSSIIDSDSEVEADAEGVHSNYVVKKLGQQMTYPPNSHDLPDFNKGFQVVSQQISPSAPPGVAGVGPLAEQVLNGGLALTPHSTAAGASSPQIGSIALTNSTDVTFGDKHFYEGPVTIQQFLIDGRDKWKGTPPDGDGHDNPTFAHENGVNHAAKAGGDHPQEPQQEKPFGFILNRKAIITTSIIVFLTVFIAVIIFTATDLLNAPLTQSKLIGDGDDSRKNIPINSTIAKDNIGGGRVLRVLPRDAWLAEPPQSPPIALDLPAKRIIVLPTQTDDCTTQAACTYRVRYIQTYNIESLRHDDIIYNFLIGGDGSVYEGRGWEHKGAHLKGFNDDSISFAFIGTFRKQPPAAKQMNVTSLLIAEGLRLGKLATDYKIYGAKLLEPSAPSADALYASFKGWPHWVEAN